MLITGGNSGIGRGIVHRFASEGYRVLFVGRDDNKGIVVEREITDLGAEGRFYRVDLSDEVQVSNLIEQIQKKYKSLDVVVNNAGLGSRRSGVTQSDAPGARWDKLRGANLDAAYYVSSYSLPLLKTNRGAIVNISSTATFHGNWGLYGVAKAGIEALTRSFAVEGASNGVRVNCVSPGWIETEQDKEQPASGKEYGVWDMPPSLLNRMGTPTEIANTVFFLASDEASFITGQVIIVDGGLVITDYPSTDMLDKVGDRLMSQP